jgi:hypothetical protein
VHWAAEDAKLDAARAQMSGDRQPVRPGTNDGDLRGLGYDRCSLSTINVGRPMLRRQSIFVKTLRNDQYLNRDFSRLVTAPENTEKSVGLKQKSRCVQI